ncbi:MAG: molybdopterin-guanine dinucleotide biosynthesis protein B [Desulfobacterales bacterium]|nr:molybdopterin-guanine dinucleotide biosynthesis protein B [Desulfobacterales bacterium]
MQTIVQIIGRPGAGKTTLVAGLVRYFTGQGLCVGTLKHSSHAYELDKPGKDSHVHRQAGAIPAAMVNAEMAALYFPASDFTRPEQLIQTYYRHATLVLIEGWISGPYPKIEIWRQCVGKAPLFKDVEKVCALVCDSVPADTGKKCPPIFALDDIPGLAGFIQL